MCRGTCLAVCSFVLLFLDQRHSFYPSVIWNAIWNIFLSASLKIPNCSITLTCPRINLLASNQEFWYRKCYLIGGNTINENLFLNLLFPSSIWLEMNFVVILVLYFTFRKDFLLIAVTTLRVLKVKTLKLFYLS